MQAKENENYKPIDEQIFNILTKQMNSVVRKEDIKEVVSSIVRLLAPRRKQELLEHLKICKEYERLKAKEMPMTQLRSIIRRKFKINNALLTPNCERCEKFLSDEKGNQS